MNLDESTIQELIDCLQWYVETDETYEGGRWEEENAFWLEGKRKAEALLERIKESDSQGIQP